MSENASTSQLTSWQEGWLNWLRAERNYADHTLDGYARDVEIYLSFLQANEGVLTRRTGMISELSGQSAS